MHFIDRILFLSHMNILPILVCTQERLSARLRDADVRMSAAEAARSSMASAKTVAEASKARADVAAAAAELRATAAETARNTALAAKTAAETAKSNSDAAITAAEKRAADAVAELVCEYCSLTLYLSLSSSKMHALSLLTCAIEAFTYWYYGSNCFNQHSYLKTSSTGSLLCLHRFCSVLPHLCVLVLATGTGIGYYSVCILAMRSALCIVHWHAVVTHCSCRRFFENHWRSIPLESYAFAVCVLCSGSVSLPYLQMHA
jgi:hypothetical protein